MANVTLPTLNFPLSGPVTQSILPWTNYFTVNVGQSSDADVEKDVLANTASYGKQLGRIADVLILILKYHPLPEDRLSDPERRALADLKGMLHQVADAKEKHDRSLVLRPQ